MSAPAPGRTGSLLASTQAPAVPAAGGGTVAAPAEYPPLSTTAPAAVGTRSVASPVAIQVTGGPADSAPAVDPTVAATAPTVSHVASGPAVSHVAADATLATSAQSTPVAPVVQVASVVANAAAGAPRAAVPAAVPHTAAPASTPAAPTTGANPPSSTSGSGATPQPLATQPAGVTAATFTSVVTGSTGYNIQAQADPAFAQQVVQEANAAILKDLQTGNNAFGVGGYVFPADAPFGASNPLFTGATYGRTWYASSGTPEPPPSQWGIDPITGLPHDPVTGGSVTPNEWATNPWNQDSPNYDASLYTAAGVTPPK